MVERITPWLLDLGNWIFGGLIALNLLILGSLLTIGPGNRAVIIATAALALALPPDIAGFLLLRLAADMKNVDLEEVATKAFVDAGFGVEEQPASPDPGLEEKRRAKVVLRYSYALLALTILLTVIGVTAALWYMAWWIAIAFVAMIVVSQALVFGAVVATGAPRKWKPPVSGGG